MAVDLHAHSTASDGSDPPRTLVRRAARIGLSAVALTDHDTQEGIAEAEEAAVAAGIELVPGVELSLDHPGMHLLVLFLEPGAGPLQDRLAGLQAGRDDRNARIVEVLQGLGMDITLEDVEAEAGGGSVGRPHIAAVMARKGYVPDIPTAFEEYLAAGRPAYQPRPRLSPADALDLACRSGGVPVLAHPHTLGLADHHLEDLLDELAGHGLVGLECLYATYTPDERARLVEMARRHGLAVSGGSDYHGTYKEGLQLGIGFGDLVVPEKVLEGLRERRPR